MIKEKFRGVFNITVEIIFAVILLFLVLGIALGAIQLFRNLWALLSLDGITGKYIGIITDVLTLYVLVELSRSLVEYFDTNRLRLTFILDAAIVFIIREILINLFKHELQPEMLNALTLFLFALGVLRLGSVLVYQREKQMAQDISIKKE